MPTGFIVVLSMALVMEVIFAIALMRLFGRAGVARWKALIPLVQIWGMLEVVRYPSWMLLLLLFPGANVILWLLMSLEFATRFGRTGLFGLGVFFLSPIFLPILAFSDARYSPPKPKVRRTPATRRPVQSPG